jgi:iron complex outermembrane recepter protein
MYGFGSPGGVINFATKRPTPEPYFSADIGVRTKNLINRHIDAGGPLNDWLGYRFNAVQETGDTYNGGHNDNRSFSLNLDAKPTDRLVISLDSFFMKTIQKDQINTLSVSATAPVTHLDPIDPKFPIGAKGSFKANKIYVLNGRADYEINDNWHFNAGYQFSHLDENFPGNNLSIISNSGNATSSAFFVRRTFDFRQLQANFAGKFDTGQLTHDLIVGVDDKIISFWGDLHSSPTVALGTINIYTGPGPTLASYPVSRYDPKLYMQNKYRERSAFLIDTIGWNDWELLVGGRYTKYTNIARSLQNVVTAQYDQNVKSPTVALSYKLASNTRVYGSYTQGFENGGAPPATAVNFGETFPAIRSKQKEVGIKTQQSTWNGTVALFRIDRGAGYVDNNNVYLQDGNTRYQGIETTASWKPLSSLSLGASYRYQTSKFRKTAPAQLGKDVPGNPDNQAVIFGSYFLPNLPDLNLNAQVRYQDGGYVNPNNLLRLPSVTTLDVGAGYRFEVDGHDIALRASIKNVTNKKYWNVSSSLSPGDPRFQVTAEFIF